MASFNGNRYPPPMFNQNFPQNVFNLNPAGNIHSMQPFQRPPNPTFMPCQPPERFVHGNFPNRPNFSNFPQPRGPPGFGNRPPPPDQIFSMNPPQPRGPPEFGNRPPPPDQIFSMNPPQPRCPPEFGNRPPPPDQIFSMNPPQPRGPPGFGNRPPPPDQVFPMNPPQPRGPPGFGNRPPPPDQVFPMNPAHNFPRPRGPFESPCRSWIRPPPYRGPSLRFQNRPRTPVPSHQFGDLHLPANRKGRLNNRDFRKLKDDTAVKPFSCDTCDKAFVTENELRDHTSQHIRCNHANCMFEAHPKIVALHKKMQHDTGYADRINRLKDDADIQKWREERRRRFPTVETIRKRKAEQAEKEERGEVLETKEFGKFKRRKEDSRNNRNELNKDVRRRRGRNFKSNDRRRNFHPRTQPVSFNVDSESDSDSDSHITLHRFLGMSSLTNSSKEIMDKNEDTEITSSSHIDISPTSSKHHLPPQSLSEQNLPKSEFDNSISHPNVPVTDSNSSILDRGRTTFVLNDDKFNGTTSNSLSEVPIDESTTTKQNGLKVEASFNESICEVPVNESIHKQNDAELVEIKDSDDEGPIAVPFVKSIENSHGDDQDIQKIFTLSPNTVPKASDITKAENGHSRSNNRPAQHLRGRHNYHEPSSQESVQVARKSSLLEKLLADDIRRERNVILQCIRHIVKNNFFGIENKCLK